MDQPQQHYPSQPATVPAQRVRDPMRELDELGERLAAIEARIEKIEKYIPALKPK